MLNPYSNFYISLLLSTIPMLTSLAHAVTSQAETRELLKRVFIVIIPQYLFEFNGFRMNLVNLIQKNYSINDRLGFGNSACDVTGSFHIPPTR